MHYQHSIFMRVTSVFNDGNNIGPLLRYIDQIATRTMGKFNRIHKTFLSRKHS